MAEIGMTATTQQLLSTLTVASVRARESAAKVDADKKAGGTATTFDQVQAEQDANARDKAWLAAVASLARDFGVPLPQTVT